MKKTTKNVLRVIISLLYIIWGIASPLTVLSAVLALDISAIISAAVGVLMLLAGIFGLLKLKSSKCKIFGVIIFVFAALSFVMGLTGGVIAWSAVISAILAWLFIICI